MFIQPGSDWQWHYDHDRQCMTLSLDQDMLFICALGKRKMNQVGLEASAFACHQTQNYYYYIDALECVDWPVPIKVQIVLNAIAICDYHKPLMPQSWFFEHQGEMQTCTKGEVMLLRTDSGDHRFLILEVEPTSALCMALETSTLLSESKVMGQFEAIKVMRDRLIPMPIAQQFAKVG